MSPAKRNPVICRRPSDNILKTRRDPDVTLNTWAAASPSATSACPAANSRRSDRPFRAPRSRASRRPHTLSARASQFAHPASPRRLPHPLGRTAPSSMIASLGGPAPPKIAPTQNSCSGSKAPSANLAAPPEAILRAIFGPGGRGLGRGASLAPVPQTRRYGVRRNRDNPPMPMSGVSLILIKARSARRAQT